MTPRQERTDSGIFSCLEATWTFFFLFFFAVCVFFLFLFLSLFLPRSEIPQTLSKSSDKRASRLWQGVHVRAAAERNGARLVLKSVKHWTPPRLNRGPRRTESLDDAFTARCCSICSLARPRAAAFQTGAMRDG